MLWWYVFTTMQGKERDAESALRDCAFTVAVPVKQMIRHFRGRKYLVRRPALRGLVFVSLATKEPSNEVLRAVLDTEYVRGFVGFNGRIGRIAEDIMAEFIAKLEAGEETNTAAGLQVGAHVRMRTGRFAELNGVVIHVGKAEARVLIDLFGRSLETKVPLVQLEELDSGAIEMSSRERRRLQGQRKSGRHIRG